MAEPKKKLSKSRTNLRRSQYKATPATVTFCTNCKKAIVPHMVCKYCGFYKGKSVKDNAPTKRIVLDANDEKASKDTK